MGKQKELAKNTIILTIGKICTQFISFLLLPLYTSLLLPEEYGTVDLITTYVALIVPLCNWQFESGLFRFLIDYREKREQQKTLFSTVIITNIMQAFVFLILYLCIQNFVHSEYKIFLLLNVELSIFLNTFLQFPRGLGNNTNYTVASFISAVSTVISNVIFIAIFKMGAYGLLFSSILAQIITIIYLFISEKMWQYISFKQFDKVCFKQVFQYSIPLVPNQLSWWIVGVSDRTIVSYFLGVAANGIYSIANKFSSVFITFYNIFNLSWTESVALHIHDDDSQQFLEKTINLMFQLFSAICLGIIAVMPFAFPIMIKSNYAGAYEQIPILMLAVLFQVVVGLYSVIYVALKKSTEIAKTSFYAAVINIVVDLVLIKFIGIYAASISTLVAQATMATYRYFHVKKYIDIKLNAKYLILTIVTGGMILVSYYYNHLISNSIVLLLTILYAVWINKDFLQSVCRMIGEKIKK